MVLEVVLGILIVMLVDTGRIGNIRLCMGRYLDSRAILISATVFFPLKTTYTVVLCHYNGNAYVGKSGDNVIVCPQRNTKKQRFTNKTSTPVHSDLHLDALRLHKSRVWAATSRLCRTHYIHFPRLRGNLGQQFTHVR